VGKLRKIIPMHSKKKLKGQVHVLTNVDPKDEEGDQKRKCKAEKPRGPATGTGYLRSSVACQMWHADSLI
jgi:hypothetical protein